MTLLTFTDVATDFAVRSRRLTSLPTSSAVACVAYGFVGTCDDDDFVDRVCLSGLVNHFFYLFESGSRFIDNPYPASIVRRVEVDIAE